MARLSKRYFIEYDGPRYTGVWYKKNNVTCVILFETLLTENKEWFQVALTEILRNKRTKTINVTQS